MASSQRSCMNPINDPRGSRRGHRRSGHGAVLARAALAVVVLIVAAGAGATDLIVYREGYANEIQAIRSDGTDARTILGPPTGGGIYGTMALSESGEHLMYQRYLGGWNDELWTVRMDGTGNQLLTPAAWLDSQLWLMDGVEVGYKRAGGTWESMYRTDVATGTEALWVDASQMQPWGLNKFAVAFRMSADRTKAAFIVGVGGGGNHSVFSAGIDADTGTLSDIVRVSPQGAGWWCATGVDVTADGSRVYYSWQDRGQNRYQILSVNADGSDTRLVCEMTNQIGTFGNIRLSPDGSEIYFTTVSQDGPGFAIASVAADGSGCAGYSELVTGPVQFRFDVAAACEYGPPSPFDFVRGTGRPVVESASWDSCGGPGQLVVAVDGVCSALIWLNGELVAGPSDFRGATDQLSIPVVLLEGANTVDVELRSAPGSGIVIDAVDEP